MVVTLGQQYYVGEKPAVILYTNINRHAGTPNKTETMQYTVKWGYTIIVPSNHTAIEASQEIKERYDIIFSEEWNIFVLQQVQ